MRNVKESVVLRAIHKEARQTSRRAVARRVGVDPSDLCDMLNGKQRVSGRIAAAFGFEREVITKVVFRKVA